MGLLSLGGRFLVGGIFILTAYSKLSPMPGLPWSIASLETSLDNFGLFVDGYQILPPWGVSLVAHLLPFVELGLGVWLIAGVALHLSSVLSAATMLTFFIAQLSVYLRNMVIKCGCGLFAGEQIGPLSLTIDALLFLVCLAIAIDAFRSRNRAERTLMATEQSIA